MIIDILSYRLIRLWRVIGIGLFMPLATVLLTGWHQGEFFPFLTLVAMIVPTAHVLRYPNNWKETVTISLVLSLCLALASTNGPELTAGEVNVRMFWLAILALILFFVLVQPISMLLSSGPLANIRCSATRRSTLATEALKKAVTIYPGRTDERTICGEADDTGLVPVTVKVKFDTVQYVIEDCDPNGDPAAQEDLVVDEGGIAECCFHAIVHSSGPDHHEVFTYLDGSDDVGATRYEFRDLGARGSLVRIEETGSRFPLGDAFGLWLTGYMADFLTDQVDRAEGRRRRANRAFVHKQLVVDLANILLPWLGGQKAEKPSN